MLKAIWPSIQSLPNHLPASANITTAGVTRDVASHAPAPADPRYLQALCATFSIGSFRCVSFGHSRSTVRESLLIFLFAFPLQFPFMLISPQRIRWLFLVKALVVPAAWLAMMIWAFVKVPASEGLFAQRSALSGASLSWAWLNALNSALGIYSTLSVNIPDFTVSSLHVPWSRLIFTVSCHAEIR